MPRALGLGTTFFTLIQKVTQMANSENFYARLVEMDETAIAELLRQKIGDNYIVDVTKRRTNNYTSLDISVRDAASEVGENYNITVFQNESGRVNGTFVGIKDPTPETPTGTNDGRTPIGRALKKLKENYKDWADAINVFSSIASVSTRDVSVWIGYIPLTFVENLEVGWSDRTLKYRSSGLMFLAHQMGEYDGLAVRVSFKLMTPLKNLTLMALEELKTITSTTLKREEGGENNELLRRMNDELLRLVSQERMDSEKAYYRIMNKYNVAYANDPSGNPAFDWIERYYHLTIPFVSRLIVIRKAYIETLHVTNNSKNPDIYDCEIMIRKFVEQDYEEKAEGPGKKFVLDKKDTLDYIYNKVLRIFGSIYDLAAANTLSPVCIYFLESLHQILKASAMATGLIGSIPGEINLKRSLNPGFVNFSRYDWEYKVWEGKDFPVFEEWNDYTFFIEKRRTVMRSADGEMIVKPWFHLAVYDSNNNVVANEKIVSDLIYTIPGTNIKYCFDVTIDPIMTNDRLILYIRDGEVTEY